MTAISMPLLVVTPTGLLGISSTLFLLVILNTLFLQVILSEAEESAHCALPGGAKRRILSPPGIPHD